MSQAQLQLGTVICRNEALLFNNIGSEVVMMDIEQGSYYGLEKVAARIWSLTEQPSSIAALCDRLIAEYDVAAERCRTEVTAFVGELVGRGIVNVVS